MNLSPEIIAGFVALSSVIAILWARFEYTVKRLEGKLDSCEKDRVELWKDSVAVWKALANNTETKQ